jgi:hypothetical protein
MPGTSTGVATLSATRLGIREMVATISLIQLGMWKMVATISATRLGIREMVATISIIQLGM